jgi:hypothetical protein
MKKIEYETVLLAILCVDLAFLLVGCAFTTQSIRTEATGTNGIKEVRTTQSRAVAWGDARQVIEKLKLTNGKTQSVGISGLESESTTTNIASNLKALTDLLQALKTP